MKWFHNLLKGSTLATYTDNFYEVWKTRFEPFRNKDWARKGKCAECRKWRDCLGGGMHNWHGSCDSPLTCQML